MTTTSVVVECPRQLDPQPIEPPQSDPREIAAPWAMVEHCPACGSDDGASRGTFPDRHYVFGAEQIPLPDSGIAIIGCEACGLAYKSALPTPGFLAGVFQRQTGAKWVGCHDFSEEALALQRLTGNSVFDLLDVGAAEGALLHACADSGIKGRRSALDVLRYPGVETYLAGEFIEGFLDAPSLTWSHDPYDVVTLFDVLEHLYQPQVAFENLRLLVKQGGLVFIETGNTGSFWPLHYGISQWWYVRLIEHHIFWSRQALEKIAAVFGFEIIFWEEGRHKSRRHRRVGIGVAKELLKVGLYCAMANYYSSIARLFGRQGNQPWHPFTRDHFQACLRKK